MPSRFVILHHCVNGSEHWDLMIEHKGVLLTWQLDKEPVNLSSLPIRARRIDDHRVAYLDYEGEISGNRGEVWRVDAGASHIKELTVCEILVRLEGRRLAGDFTLSNERNEDWAFDRSIN